VCSDTSTRSYVLNNTASLKVFSSTTGYSTITGSTGEHPALASNACDIRGHGSEPCPVTSIVHTLPALPWAPSQAVHFKLSDRQFCTGWVLSDAHLHAAHDAAVAQTPTMVQARAVRTSRAC